MIIDRTPARFRPAAVLTFRTVDDSFKDRVPGLAAEIAFFLLLSLIPLMLAILGTIGFIAEAFDTNVTADVVERLAELSSNVFSEMTVRETVRPVLEELVKQGRGDVATLGFILTFFSASRALRVVVVAITIAYDLEETRPGWHQRIWGLGLTLAGILTAMIVVPLLVVGPGFGRVLADLLPMRSGIAQIWAALYWPTAFVLATALVTTLFHLAAPWWTPWRRDVPGAGLSVVLFLLGTVGLRAYTATSFGDGAVYGQFAAPLVILLWFWISAMALLIGAELNAEIEKLWPTTTQRDEHERAHASDAEPVLSAKSPSETEGS